MQDKSVYKVIVNHPLTKALYDITRLNDIIPSEDNHEYLYMISDKNNSEIYSVVKPREIKPNHMYMRTYSLKEGMSIRNNHLVITSKDRVVVKKGVGYGLASCCLHGPSIFVPLSDGHSIETSIGTIKVEKMID